jgi:hypothetical protein
MESIILDQRFFSFFLRFSQVRKLSVDTVGSIRKKSLTPAQKTRKKSQVDRGAPITGIEPTDIDLPLG